MSQKASLKVGWVISKLTDKLFPGYQNPQQNISIWSPTIYKKYINAQVTLFQECVAGSTFENQ